MQWAVGAGCNWYRGSAPLFSVRTHAAEQCTDSASPCQIDVTFLRQIVTEIGPGWQAKKKKFFLNIIKNHKNSIQDSQSFTITLSQAEAQSC